MVKVLDLTLLLFQICLALIPLFLGEDKSVASWLHLLEDVEVVTDRLDPPEETCCVLEGTMGILIRVVRLAKDILNASHHVLRQACLIVLKQLHRKLRVSEHFRPNRSLPIAGLIDTLRRLLDDRIDIQ